MDISRVRNLLMASSSAVFNAVTPIKMKPVSAKPSGYKVVNKGGDSAEIYVYGVIGTDWFGDGVSAKQFADDLKALGKVKTIDLRINSEGGSVFDGKAMYSLLNEHPAKIVVHIDGLAASAASFLAMAGDEIEISEGGFIMIHNAYTIAMGDARELRRSAEMLDTVNNTIIDVYAARTKGDRKKITQMMDDETWMTGAEAVQNGFADRMVENLKVAACVSNVEALKTFKKVPAALKPNNRRAAAAFARIAALKA
ncbi:head maturation protease, ClpP-related [Bradyrhizobium sp. 144]|uniref:head maturation protease, ClpP-related n=1 Tax=Bradyrhizobium sp. 144 TaxID=2782620 RepID=UPI001FFA17AE|nr:head maturation protease, ClpP-related [Bradyrhizobium sp. 144]MCK1693719.1 Clp protease ClpP [Bradyrhizobium sp. 144]